MPCRVFGRKGVDRRGEFPADPNGAPLVIAKPGGRAGLIERSLQRRELGFQSLCAGLELRDEKPVAGQLAEADEGEPACSASIGLQRRTGRRRDRQLKAFAALAQAGNGAVELGCRFRPEPGAEGDEVRTVFRHPFDRRQHADDARGCTGSVEGDEAVAGNVDERFGAFGRGFEVGGFEAQPPVLGRGFVARADERDRAGNGESYDSDERAERDDLARVEAREYLRDPARVSGTDPKAKRKCRDAQRRSPGRWQIANRIRDALRSAHPNGPFPPPGNRTRPAAASPPESPEM